MAKNIYGIHFISAVWSVGLNLAGQLKQQGFLYVCHPTDIDSSQYESITQELANGAFKKMIDEDDEEFLMTQSEVLLKTARISKLQISMDPEYKITKQENGFIVSHAGVQAPIAWMLHCGEKDRLVNPQYGRFAARYSHC